MKNKKKIFLVIFTLNFDMYWKKERVGNTLSLHEIYRRNVYSERRAHWYVVSVLCDKINFYSSGNRRFLRILVMS